MFNPVKIDTLAIVKEPAFEKMIYGYRNNHQ